MVVIAVAGAFSAAGLRRDQHLPAVCMTGGGGFWYCWRINMARDIFPEYALATYYTPRVVLLTTTARGGRSLALPYIPGKTASI